MRKWKRLKNNRFHIPGCSIHDFTDELLLTDEISTVRFVAAQLSPLNGYRDPIVCTPGDVTLR